MPKLEKLSVTLDVLRNKLKTNPEVYFAGELTAVEDNGSRFDEHDLFVSPQIPEFSPQNLTLFTENILAGTKVDFLRKANLHSNGNLQLPDAHIDQQIGQRKIKTIIETQINMGSFKGISGKVTEEETDIEKLIQRTIVKVFTDPMLAQNLFDYCEALIKEKLDESESTNLFSLYATHIVSAEQLEKLKQHYEAPQNMALAIKKKRNPKCLSLKTK